MIRFWWVFPFEFSTLNKTSVYASVYKCFMEKPGIYLVGADYVLRGPTILNATDKIYFKQYYLPPQFNRKSITERLGIKSPCSWG